MILTLAPPSDPILNPPFHEKTFMDAEPFWSKESTGTGTNASSNSSLSLSRERNDIYKAIQRVFQTLVVFCDICDLNLSHAIVKKMELNGRKYPVELCKVCFVSLL